MYLSKIFKDIKTDDILLDINIQNITHDSRKDIGGNFLFIAIDGLDFDGHKFIENAYQKGGRYFVVNKSREKEFKEKFPDAFFIAVENTQKALPIIVNNFYGDSSSKMKIIGITGTNGKTTTAFAVYSVLRKLGKKAGLIGTIEHRINDEIRPALNTTPDALCLNQLMTEMVEKGVEYLVMEVSSHALALGRVDGINFDIAAFTNFTQDHLDYHKTMEEYLLAKLKIFDLLKESEKNKKIAILNKEGEQFSCIVEYINKIGGINFKTVSLQDDKADYYANDINTMVDFSRFNLNDVPIKISMAGEYNVYNFTMAMAILSELDIDIDDIADYLSDIKVKGRMESIPNNKGIGVIVDYAHTPDGLENLLNAVYKIKKPENKIITVFGAGGDRDKTKRSKMGEIASKLSDYIIITSDNPRTEDPEKIIRDIENGIDKNNCEYEVIIDRRKAIEQALKKAKKGDIVVIAGKGHEGYQIIGKEKSHFSDKEEVEEFFNTDKNI